MIILAQIILNVQSKFSIIVIHYIEEQQQQPIHVQVAILKKAVDQVLLVSYILIQLNQPLLQPIVVQVVEH